MAITWYNERKKDCIATLYDTNITLNRPTSIFVDRAYKVMLGVDEANKFFYIKPITKDEVSRSSYDKSELYNITLKSSYSRITNKGFMKEIKRILGLDEIGKEPKKFLINYDEDEKVLIVDLKEEL